jgi:hypothetical protein
MVGWKSNGCEARLYHLVFAVWRFDEDGALRSQNQFAVLGQTQPVLAAIVLDDQFICCSEQRSAGHPHRSLVIWGSSAG